MKANSKKEKLQPSRLHAAGAFLLATLLALVPTPVASQGDSATVQVVRVIDGDTITMERWKAPF